MIALRRVATLCFLVMAAFAALPAAAEPRVLIGAAAHRERIALPPSARLDVMLVETSRADASARVIATTSVTSGRAGPIPYRLPVEGSLIQPDRAYALRATISVDGALWFTTTTPYPVFTEGGDRTNLLVQRIGGAHPAGNWLAEDIRGGGVIDRLQSVLAIAADGAVSGTGGCNRMTGKAAISDRTLRFGPIASTRMACAPAAMDQEGKFFAALEEARAWSLDQMRGKLVLLDEKGAVLIVFARMSPSVTPER